MMSNSTLSSSKSIPSSPTMPSLSKRNEMQNQGQSSDNDENSTTITKMKFPIFSPKDKTTRTSSSSSSSHNKRIHHNQFKNMNVNSTSRLSTSQNRNRNRLPLSPLGMNHNNNNNNSNKKNTTPGLQRRLKFNDDVMEKENSKVSSLNTRKRKSIAIFSPPPPPPPPPPSSSLSLKESGTTREEKEHDEIMSVKEQEEHLVKKLQVSSSTNNNEVEQSTSVDKISTKGVDTTEEPTIDSVHKTPMKKIKVQFPTDIQVPQEEKIRIAHEEAMNVESSHQQQLKRAGSNLLSLEEVLIPCIIHEHKGPLKKIQGKAQGYKDQDAVDIMLSCRSALETFQNDVVCAVRDCRSKHEEEQKAERIRKEMEEKEDKIQRRKVRELKKIQREEQVKKELEAKRREEQAERERKRMEQKKNYPRNKELWREVAQLMTDLASLEKEESMWKNADSILNKMEKESEQRVQDLENENAVSLDGDDKMMQDSAFETLNPHERIANITLSANRINSALVELSQQMKQSEEVRKELYNKYKKDHMFHGYFGVKDPKSLIRALALD